MRIQKYISQCGVCSRRAAEEKILEGAVTVNGEIAQIGQDVDPEKDKVAVDGVTLKGIVAEKVVLAMNKPKGYLCSNDDPFEAKKVFDLLPPPYDKMKLFCCGRLDKNSQGLLILTNDGELANKITHPSSGIIKRYRVTLNRPLDNTNPYARCRIRGRKIARSKNNTAPLGHFRARREKSGSLAIAGAQARNPQNV